MILLLVFHFDTLWKCILIKPAVLTNFDHHNRPPFYFFKLLPMKIIIAYIACSILSFTHLYAATGDTSIIQVFTFAGTQDTVAVFPAANERYEKILMYYTLKCVETPGGAGGLGYPCGEWDYLSYTYLYQLSDNERFEIARYITPYGINLSLGDGFTWIFDVSDYRPLLTDSIRITAGNWQEWLDLKFIFIEGIPARDPLKVENLWSGNPHYGTNTPIENFLTTKSVSFGSDMKNARLKVRVTGHGFGGNENCAEFCAKQHFFKIDGVQRHAQTVWRDDCAYNPVFPQGGTWVYNRANWCPGAEVETYDMEISEYVQPNNTHAFDYEIEPYTWNGSGSVPYYAIEAQVVSYGLPNFSLDAAIDDIVAPSATDIFSRKNPICSYPVVKIKNNGTEALQTLVIKYGVAGGEPCFYRWNGNLKFLETEIVTLPLFNWNGLDTGNAMFYAEAIEPNFNSDDEYELNNKATVPFYLPPVYDTAFVIFFKTNSVPEQNAFYLKNAQDSIIFSRTNMAANFIYRDTIHLSPGCYKFIVTDQGEDGLSWWANNDGHGYARFKKLNVSGFWENFNADFGAEIYHEFMAGYPLGNAPNPPECEDITSVATVSKKSPEIKLFPNPNSGEFILETVFEKPQNITVSIGNFLGMSLWSKSFSNTDYLAETFQLQGLPSGIYIITIHTETGMYSKRFVVR